MELSTAIHLLGDILGEVIGELESPELFAIEERIRIAAKDRRGGNVEAMKQLAAEVEALDVDQARAVSAAFTTYFELINLAEENHRVAQLRERVLSPEPLGESVIDAIALLKKDGVTEAQMRFLLSELSIELVLTAHPTEARRRTVLSKLQRLARLLDQTSTDRLSAREREKNREAIHAEVAALWLTDSHRTERPAVTDEVRTGLQFVESVFWDTLPALYEDLEDALASYYPEVNPPSKWLHLASWMGGDRDGNPNVDHEVTAETLRLHRGLAVESHRRTFQELARRLSMSDRRLPPLLVPKPRARAPCARGDPGAAPGAARLPFARGRADLARVRARHDRDRRRLYEAALRRLRRRGLACARGRRRPGRVDAPEVERGTRACRRSALAPGAPAALGHRRRGHRRRLHRPGGGSREGARL